MTVSRRSAWIQVFLWTLIFVGLCVAVLAPGVTRFDDPDRSPWRLLVAVLILIGFGFNIWVMWRAHRGRRNGELDERDDVIARRASEVTLMAVAVLVFSASLALYTSHAESGAVPAAWLYLLAYGTMALVFLVHAAATLLVDLTGSVDA